MNIHRLLIVVTAAALTLGTAYSQTEERPIPRMPAKQELPDIDRAFLRDGTAVEWRLREIAAFGREHAKSGTARRLADEFGREKATAVSNLEDLAENRHFVLPPHDQKLRADWVRKGNFSDAQFIDAMVDELRSAVRIYEKASRSTDREIADLANRRLPELRKNFDAAHQEQLDLIDRSRRR
jgi:hypothetical protein